MNGALPPSSSRRMLEVVGGVAEDLLAGADTAGERDEARHRVLDQRSADALRRCR